MAMHRKGNIVILTTSSAASDNISSKWQYFFFDVPAFNEYKNDRLG